MPSRVWLITVPTSHESYVYGHCRKFQIRTRRDIQSKWIEMRTIPSKLAPYPALPRFPIAQAAGHKPATPFRPGNVTATSRYPPVKQN